MRIDILALFPELIAGAFEASIIRRAQDAGRVQLRLHNLRDYTTDRHRTVDAAPYGGGPGMVMRPEPWFRAVEQLREHGLPGRVVLLTPQGDRLEQARVRRLAAGGSPNFALRPL